MNTRQNIIIEDTLERISDIKCRDYLCHVFCHDGYAVFNYNDRTHKLSKSDCMIIPERFDLISILETIKLINGVEMPTLGYGVFMVSPDECKRCVSDALAEGYRLIDTAQAYRNEEGVGAAIAESGIPREEIFITTKVWISNSGEQRASTSIDESLRKLRTDHIDLLLIHQAYGDVFGTWRAMEKAYKDGKVRAIGVSNFQTGAFSTSATTQA